MKEEKKNFVGSKGKKFESKSIKIAKNLHLPPPLLYTCVRDTAFEACWQLQIRCAKGFGGAVLSLKSMSKCYYTSPQTAFLTAASLQKANRIIIFIHDTFSQCLSLLSNIFMRPHNPGTHFRTSSNLHKWLKYALPSSPCDCMHGTIMTLPFQFSHEPRRNRNPCRHHFASQYIASPKKSAPTFFEPNFGDSASSPHNRRYSLRPPNLPQPSALGWLRENRKNRRRRI